MNTANDLGKSLTQVVRCSLFVIVLRRITYARERGPRVGIVTRPRVISAPCP
jgi:hypothetical protein